MISEDNFVFWDYDVRTTLLDKEARAHNRIIKFLLLETSIFCHLVHEYEKKPKF